MTPQQAAVLVKCMDELREHGLESRVVSGKQYPVLLAYSQGKTIQVLQPTGKWDDIPDPSFAPIAQYRVKPEPKYRPFTPEELIWLVGRTVTREDGQQFEVDYFYHSAGGSFVRIVCDPQMATLGPVDLLAHYKLKGGSPCGFEVAE